MKILLSLLALTAFVGVFGHASPANALSLWPFGDKGLSFDIAISGIENNDRRKELEGIAKEAVSKENPPETVLELEAFAGMMRQRVLQSLEAEGRYEAAVTHIVNTDGKKPTVNIDVVPGRIFTVSGAEVEWNSMDAAIGEQAFEAHHLKKGRPLNAANILLSANAMERAMADGRCFLSFAISPGVILDKDNAVGAVRYRIEAGPEADFGALNITGQRTMKDEVVARYVSWEEGECFSRDKVQGTETALLRSRLFSVARITASETINDEGRTALTLELKERAPRTVSAGVTFATDVGAGVKAGWEHRNVKGLAHTLTTKAAVSQQEISASAGYSIPFFRGDKQTLRFTTELKQENTDSYEATSASALASVERRISKELTGGLGLGARYSEVRQNNDTEGFFLLYAPLFVAYDNRDDTLDPRKGIAARVTVTPYADLSGVGKGFVKTQGEFKTYLTADDVPLEPTLALRAALGMISGASAGDVPADTRFNAGGGGSVRGYAFQSIGPRNAAGEPDGGTNLTEFGGEVRVRFNESFGGAVFMEGAGLSQESAPFQSLDMFWAAGAGVRYFSPLGPFRVDVGVPLRELDADDSAFQVYVSLGQAF